jgi:hypothetical protein
VRAGAAPVIEPLYTPGEVQDKLGLPWTAVLRLTRLGVIPAAAVVTTPRGTRRYRPAAIDSLAAALCRDCGTPAARMGAAWAHCIVLRSGPCARRLPSPGPAQDTGNHRGERP